MLFRRDCICSPRRCRPPSLGRFGGMAPRQGRSDGAGPARRLLSSAERPYRGLHATKPKIETGRIAGQARTAERAASLRWARSRRSASMRCTASTATAASRPRARSAIRPSSRWCRSASSGLGSCRRFRTSPARARSCCSCCSAISSPASATQAAWWFQYFAGSAAQATAIGIIGTAAIGVLLLVTVEDQLNAVWRVTVPRPWVQRVLAYWTLITMGPLLIGTSLTLSTYLNHRGPARRPRPGRDRPVRQRLAAFAGAQLCRSCSNGSPVRCSIASSRTAPCAGATRCSAPRSLPCRSRS